MSHKFSQVLTRTMEILRCLAYTSKRFIAISKYERVKTVSGF